MTASEVPTGGIYSGFTFALFEDMGWYEVNKDLEEPIFWGKNKGCDFFN